MSTFELLELLQLLRDMNQDRNSASIDASSGRSRAATIPDMSLLYTEQLPEDRIDLLLRLLFLCRIFIQYILAVCPPPHQAHHFDTLNSPLAIPTSDGASASVSSSSSALNAAAFDASGRPPVGSTVDLEGGDASTLPVSTSAAMPRNRSWFAWWSGNPVEDSSAAHPEMESRVNVPSVSPPPEEEGLDASFSPPQILPPPSIPPDHDPGVQDQLLHSLQSLFTSGNLLSRFVSSLVQACVQIPLTPSGIDLKVELLNVILVLLSSQMYAPPEDATNGLRFFRLIPSDLTPQLVQVMLQQYIAVNDHLPEHHDPASQNSASTSSSSSGPLSPSAAGSARLPHQVKHTLTRAAKGAFALILWPLKLPVRLFRLLFGTDEISHHALSRRSLMLLVILANQSEFPEFRAALGEITDSDLASLILSSSTDLDGAGSPGMSPSSAAPGHSVSFSALYNLFCSNLECEDGDFLLLYAFLMSNSSFKEFVLARTDIDALVVPLLQHLYREAVAGGARLRSRTEGHSSWAVEDPDMDEEEEENQEETRRRYVYVLLIILLVLTQDVAFCESVHSHVYVSGAHLAGWLTEERSPAAASLFSGSPLIPQFLSAAAALSGDRTARGGGAGVEGDTGSSRLRHRRPSVVLHAAKGLGNQLIMPLSALAGFVMGRGSGDSGQSSRHLVDRSGCSLGSLTFIVILRLLVLNLTQDPYIHGTCVGVLSNLARHASGLHPYACHRLVKLLELLARRFLPVALTPAVANVPGESKSDASGGGMGTAARAMDAAKEADSIIVSALRIVTDCLSARLIASNTFLVYELLYSRNSAIEPFRGHRRYWGNVEHLCAVIYHIQSVCSVPSSAPFIVFFYRFPCSLPLQYVCEGCDRGSEKFCLESLGCHPRRSLSLACRCVGELWIVSSLLLCSCCSSFSALF